MIPYLEKVVAEAVPVEYRDLVRVFPSAHESQGDYATNIAMQLARKMKNPPMEIAESIVKNFQPKGLAEMKSLDLSIAPPGYINIKIPDESIMSFLTQKKITKSHSKTIMVEYGHPNPFKVLHIGHLRNFCLGESLCRLLEWNGATVIRTNYQGDVGMHVAKNIWAFRKAVKEDPELLEKLKKMPVNERVEALSGWYVEGAKAYEESEELKNEIQEINAHIYDKSNEQINELWLLGVTWSLEKFSIIYARLDTKFERQYMESETLEGARKYVKEALEKGILEKSDGAIVFKGEKYGLDTRVFENSKGYLTYEGKELGLAHMEFTDFGVIDTCIHNVGVEQKSFFSVTFKVEELLWPSVIQGKQYHHAYELVGLKSGKMSSRKGQVITGESILNEAYERIAAIVKKNGMELDNAAIDTIALAAVKYSYLKMSFNTYLSFDMDASMSFEGDSGPYLLYTYARARSVLEKYNKVVTPQVPTFNNPDERKVALILVQYEDVVSRAVAEYAPHHIATYLNSLAQAFNAFYAKHKIGDNSLRLFLTHKVAETLKEGLYLLGIQTVERM